MSSAAVVIGALRIINQNSPMDKTWFLYSFVFFRRIWNHRALGLKQKAEGFSIKKIAATEVVISDLLFTLVGSVQDKCSV